MLIEVIGNHQLPDDVDRDDVEDLLATALRADGDVTGAGSGSGRWHLDVEVSADADQFPHVLRRLATALVGQDLGWVVLRPEHEETGKSARELA
ncbi:hypothetical protein FHG89_13575 [Micromonospora orduensis]|uniref:Uncharacterized protein n=1 Tax=Micromonospora orduensis TaxID=1420891 RepID=A0A5C4QRZ0_9ACTN|nr:hypothetical protein [Micromonospora orduensis]TNH29029.1 hypothetical protein FHG89_13575 [Micromonospora orduensis]